MRLEWALIATTLLVLAAILRQGSLLLIAVPIFMLYCIEQIWAKYALRRVDYSRHLSATRAFFGDEVTFEMHLANRKLLPLPWVQIDEELDEKLALPETVTTSPSPHPGRILLRNIIPVGWYHRVKIVHTIRCMKRGFFSFGPTRVQSGDYFRFHVREMVVENSASLIVYPRILPLDELGIPSRDPFGEILVRRHLFQDPVLVASVRDYAPGDPFRRIHWKASARMARLQTKVFEHTTSTDIAIFFDVRTVKHPFWGEVSQLLETACIATASIANDSIERGYRVGLYVNHPYPESTNPIRVRPSGHRAQLQRILQALAMVGPTESLAIDHLIVQEGGSLPWGSTIVAVAAVPTPALVAALRTFQRAGRPVALVVIGEGAPECGVDSLTTYHVPAEVAWERVDELAISHPDRSPH